MNLTSPGITELNLEQSVYTLVNEWLAGYFDGETHNVGANENVQFTVGALGFGQSSLPQPFNPTTTTQKAQSPPPVVTGITMVFATCPGKVCRDWGTIEGERQQVYYKPVRWNFWVRSATADSRAREACMQTAQLLEAILANAAETRALAGKGIHKIRPCSPEPVADATYILRLVKCTAQLRYAVMSQT